MPVRVLMIMVMMVLMVVVVMVMFPRVLVKFPEFAESHMVADFKGFLEIHGEAFFPVLLLVGLVKDRSHVVGIIPELQGIIAPEHVRPRENAFDEIFHGTQKSGQSRCPSLLLRHVHGVKHGRGHALRGNGTPGSVIHEIGIEPALQEAAHHAAQPHEVDG